MYDASKTYEENYEQGPYEHLVRNKKFPKIKYLGNAQFNFLGAPLHIPFGVPAGPLLNSKFMRVALDAGFCVPTYKTVRAQNWKCHAWPNVLKICATKKQIFSCQANIVCGNFLTAEDYGESFLSISNSFGVPSQHPDKWTQDFHDLNGFLSTDGFQPVLSFQGTKVSEGFDSFVLDAQRAALYAARCLQFSKNKILEINLSCPNESCVPIFKCLPDTVKLLRAVKNTLSCFSDVKLIAKIGALNFKDTLNFISHTHELLDAISAINTVSCSIKNTQGQNILGSGDDNGGVCGSLILDQGLEMVHNIFKARQACEINPEKLQIIGVGGVSTAEHFFMYKTAGADIVQAATGMMWNLNLASEIADALGVKYERV